MKSNKKKGRGVRVVNRSYTVLEKRVFEALEPHIEHCSRDQVKLSAPLQAKLSSLLWKRRVPEKTADGTITVNIVKGPPRPDRANVQFSVNVGAAASAVGRKRTTLQTTMGYFFLTKLRNSDARLLGVWATGGREGAVWTRILRTTCFDCMRTALKSREDRFVIGEFPMLAIDRPPDLSFAESCWVETVEGSLS